MGCTTAARGFAIFIFSILGGRLVTSANLHVWVHSASECSVQSCTWAELKCSGSDCLQCVMSPWTGFVWYKNGEVIQGQTSSTYSGYFYKEDSYACAVLGREYEASPSVCVYQQSCNTVTYESRSVCAPKGSSVEISCTYNGYTKDYQSQFWYNPKRSHRWLYPSQPEDLREDSQYAGRVRIREEVGSSYLQITDLRESDEGRYHFKFKTGSFEWRSVLPGKFVAVTDLEVRVNRMATDRSSETELSCYSSCSSYVFVWFKNGQRVSEGSNNYKTYIHPQDVITCALKGHESYPSPSAYAPRVPSIWASPSHEVMEGTSVTLTCSSDANPAAQYFLYKRLVYHNYKLLSREAQLVLRKIQPSDSGEYYCEARNGLGKHISKDIFINVKYAPKTSSVSVSPSGDIVEGHSVTLTCSSDANPTATYTWYKENHQLLRGSSGYHFTAISLENRGTYYCQSENQYGRVMSSPLFIDVKYAPKTSTVSVSPPGEIVEGSLLTLTCSSDSYPPPTHTWYKGDQQLHWGHGSIHFTSISSEDGGTYYCKSENQHGRVISSPLFIDVMYAPRHLSLSVSPSGEIVEGSSVNLTCSSDANPAARYTWYKDNQAMLRVPEGIYGFPSISLEDRGIYHCKSENHHGEMISASVFIDVQYAPKLPSVSVSLSAEIVEGSSVTLTCSSDANPAANYTWYKENQTLIQGPEGIYRFTSISPEDRGSYNCESDNQHGRINSSPLFIEVQYAPRLSSVSVSPSGEILEGSSVTLTCSSDANPAATYTWYKENQTVLQGPENIYRVPSISSGDRGIYHCKSENEHGQINSTSVFIDVQYAPKLPSVSVSPSAEIVEGSSVTLTCSSDANPAANYTWYKENQMLIQGPEGIYRFTSISPEDRGSYNCESDNQHGRTNSSPLFIEVQYAPRLSSVSVSPSGEILEGSSVTLTCSSDANPAATYTWYKENQTVLQGPEDIYRVPSISSGDRGIYHCKSENEHGQINSTSVFIDVQYAPRLTSVSVSPSGEILEGSSVTLTCSSDANPAVNYTWYKENQMLIQGPEGIYRFTSISPEDRGSYKCESDNQHGRINSSPLFIEVQYAPRLSSVSVSPSGEILEGSSVTLTCSSDANPAATYTWYKEYQTLIQGPEGIYRFTSISPEDRGSYNCESDNQHGRINSSPLFIEVQYAPRLSSVSVSPSGEILEGSSVTLTCSSDANPAATYTWYKENQTVLQGPENIYRVPSISSGDRGIYQCKSENEHGQINSTSVFIDVQYAPKLPSVSVSPSAEIVEGSSVTLTCSSDANPAANYTWYKEDEDSPEASGQIFNITDFRAEHSGNYYCEAQNTRGRHNSTSVRRKKTPPSSTTEPNVQIDSCPVNEKIIAAQTEENGQKTFLTSLL